MAGDSGDTARILILVGLVLQGIAVLLLFAFGAFLLPTIAGALGGFLLLIAFLGMIWAFLIYLYSYTAVRDGDYEDARTPTLVFGILSLIFGGFIPGILYLIAYVKIGDAVHEEVDTEFPESPIYPPASYSNPPPAAAAPAAVPPPGGPARFCSTCGIAVMPGAKFCRGCGAAIL